VDELEYLALKAKTNDKALQDLFKLLYNDIKKMSSQLFIAGSDESDIIQESRIGLWKAVQDFKPEAGMSFKNFSINVCIKRHLFTSVMLLAKNLLYTTRPRHSTRLFLMTVRKQHCLISFKTIHMICRQTMPTENLIQNIGLFS